MRCQVYIGRSLIIDTVMDPSFGPLTKHRVTDLAREAAREWYMAGKGKAILKRAATKGKGKGKSPSKPGGGC